MRVVIGWIVGGTVLAVAVLGGVSAQNSLGMAVWMVVGVTVAAGLGAMAVSVESRPPERGEG
ncbi:MAG: hypothetical protein OXS29_17285 [bacterium]|nr:hypothetical protein [bacterium]MDE0289855.1 hypothetical protein [bacterium]MDE0436804.1 hypothetical protein [bacterium]